ncbi:MAG: hypothetical protein ACRDPY_28770 [Streptosporangiaceae bacterium]
MHAQTWQDTGLSGGAVTDSTFNGTNVGVTNGTKVINLNGTGVTWALHGTVPSGVTIANGAITYSGGAVSSPPVIVADATDSLGNAEAFEMSVAITSDSIQLVGSATKVTLSTLADSNSGGTVTFSAVSSKSTGETLTFAESNLPTGLTSGNPTLTYVGGTAAPDTYAGTDVSVTDVDGAVLKGTFTLTVDANSVGVSGDEVNPFGNGFDSYQQHDYAGARVAGWPATQSDPATSFILNAGTHSGAYQFEYAPKGTASGLCVSDPGGGWRSDPLRDGLILTNCNTGPWQQFIPQSNGTLKNYDTGLYVNPAGKGGQLRGGSTTTSWGGSKYNWTASSNLPG